MKFGDRIMTILNDNKDLLQFLINVETTNKIKMKYLLKYNQTKESFHLTFCTSVFSIW